MRLSALVGALSALTLMAGCRGAPTQTVIVVHGDELVVPDEIDRVRVVVRDLDADETTFAPQAWSLCGVARDCKTFPLVLTLLPGPRFPLHRVFVRVEAYAGNDLRIGDGAVFTFEPGVSKQLDFQLYRNCLGVDCMSEQAPYCLADGSCGSLEARPFSGEPSLDGGAVRADLAGADLSRPDLAGVDLADVPDMAHDPPDLANVTVYYVAENGSAANSGLTPQEPKPKLSDAAIVAAQMGGESAILVCAGNYSDNAALNSTMGVFGGYDCNVIPWQPGGGVTSITGSAGRTLSIEGTNRVEDLTLHLDGSGGTPNATVEVGSQAVAVLRRCFVYGNADPSQMNPSAAIWVTSGGSLEMYGGSATGGFGEGSTQVYGSMGIRLEGSATIRGVTISGGMGSNQLAVRASAGIFAGGNTQRLTVEDSHIRGGAGLGTPSTKISGIEIVSGAGGDMVIRRSRIFASVGGTSIDSFGIDMNGVSTSLIIENNMIHAGGFTRSTGVHSTSQNGLVIAYNTIYARDGTAIAGAESHTIENNLLQAYTGIDLAGCSAALRSNYWLHRVLAGSCNMIVSLSLSELEQHLNIVGDQGNREDPDLFLKEITTQWDEPSNGEATLFDTGFLLAPGVPCAIGRGGVAISTLYDHYGTARCTPPAIGAHQRSNCFIGCN